MEAERNMLVVIYNCPCVHLKGHVSRCFNFVTKHFFYSPMTECSEETFIKACEKRTYNYYNSEGNIVVWNDKERIEVSKEGEVTVDGEAFTIEMQIERRQGEPTWF